ncbi:unnamed protein product [Rotaria magnacalcarata]
MHSYRISLILLHLCSSLCYAPHLIVHLKHLRLYSVTLRSKLAYIIYWCNYSLLAILMLSWCIFVVYRKQTPWQVIQASGYLCIAELIYTALDVTTRILLGHNNIVIASDFIHIIILFTAIFITFLLVQHVKKERVL